MITPQYERQLIADAKREEHEMLSVAIESVVIPRAFDHVTLASLPETEHSGEPRDQDGLVAGIYLGALHAGGEDLDLGWMHLRDDDRAADGLASIAMYESLSSPGVENHLGGMDVLSRDLTKLAIVSTLRDALMRTRVLPLFAIEVRAVSTDPGEALDYYVSFSSSRLLRRARRTVSEAVSQMKRDRQEGEIPADYEGFSFGGGDVRESSHLVGLSALHHILSDRDTGLAPTDGTIGSEPRDTH